MRFRGKSIRRKIVGLLLVPLVSLASVWAFATVITGRELMELLDVAEVVEKVGTPTEDTVQVLQKERRQTLVHLADPRTSDGLDRLHRQEQVTDRVVARLRGNAADVRDDLSPGAQTRLTEVLEGLDGLNALRRKVEEGTVTRGHVFASYNALIDPCFELLGSLNPLEDAEMDKQGRGLVGIVQAREMLAREDAVLAAALTSGYMSTRELRTFSDLVAGRKLLYSTSLPLLPTEEREVYDKYWNSPERVDLRSAEERVIAADADHAPTTIDAKRWQSAVGTVLSDLDRLGIAAGERYVERVQPVAFDVLIQAAVAGVIGFLAVVVAIVVSVRVGRGLVRDLTRLRKEAHEVSGVRLPSVMRRLAAGEQVDVETEAPRLEYGQDEMGQVGRALNTLQRAAVEAAVKQAEMRRGISEVFVNLARRSQVLLHRQLTLLDAMERRTEDAEELADLFRLDHLTTRMRRHAEGLVILSGAAPSRQWRKPIQLMDVVRAAVAEVEDYERIEIRRLPRLAVGGSAVADITHLIAELLENATVYSPPHTAVQVLGEHVANGFTLEIHDRGLGMTADGLLDANLRLAETPEFELSDTDRLGLFVVSRLARRHGVRVSLQTSPYGGTTAVVFIPAGLLVDSAGQGAVDGEPESTEETGSGEYEQPDDRFAALAQTPVPLAGVPQPAPVLDGPVELEPPLSALQDDDEGRVFRASERLSRRAAAREPDQAQGQDPRPRQGQSARQDPLPRRGSPVLVSDHGRPVENRGPRGVSRAGETRERTGSAETGAGLSSSGLPRRVRQANLAPQLKSDPGFRLEPVPESGGDEPERDPAEVRSRMASLQRGWQLGREHTGEDTRSSPSTGSSGSSGSAVGRQHQE
ncbi:sensor histidine kinase [Streptomyces sp. KR80]|uniref:sensor histidine kinase n=1 Tax=Streptomyces sp. KR80 TaxID=3457426 RepID=UPI003FD45CA0